MKKKTLSVAQEWQKHQQRKVAMRIALVLPLAVLALVYAFILGQIWAG